MSLSGESKVEAKWWLDNVDTAYNIIKHSQVDFTVYSDASLKGWVASLNDVSCGRQWSSEEAKDHVNYLELSAALFALKCSVNEVAKLEVASIDNCNKLVFKLWQFCIKNNICLTATHIPGCNNVVADWIFQNKILSGCLKQIF